MPIWAMGSSVSLDSGAGVSESNSSPNIAAMSKAEVNAYFDLSLSIFPD